MHYLFKRYSPLDSSLPPATVRGREPIHVAGRCASQREGLEGRRRASLLLCRAALPPFETLACRRERKKGGPGVS